MKNIAEEQISQYALRRYENLSNLNLQVTTDYLEAHRLDVSQLRSLVIQISVIAFGIVGFSIPIIDNANIIKTQILFILGIMLIAFCAIYGLWYINFILQKSIIKSQKGWIKNKNEIREALENERFLIKNPDKFTEYEERRQGLENKLKSESIPEMKTDYFLHFLMSLLSLGIVLLFLSLFEISIKL